MASVQIRDGAAATLTTANATPTAGLTLTLPDLATTFIKVYVAAKNGTTSGACFERTVGYRRNGNTVTLIGAAVAESTFQDAALSTTGITFVTGVGTVAITVTGVAATSIDWQIIVETVSC